MDRVISGPIAIVMNNIPEMPIRFNNACPTVPPQAKDEKIGFPSTPSAATFSG